MEIPLSQEYIHIPDEDRRCLTKVIDRARPGQVSSSVQDLTVYEGHNSFVRSPIRVFFDSMESPLSQESIYI